MIELRAALKTLGASYSRLDDYRAVTLAACPLVPTPLCPEALTAFKAAAKIEAGIEQMIRAHWVAQQSIWTSGAGSRSPFPTFDFPIATGTEEDLTRSWSNEFDLKASYPVTLSIRWTNVKVSAQLRREHGQWAIAWIE